MAACLPGILPPLDAAEALEVSMVQSVAGTLTGGRLTRTRPFRAPHHSASMAALTGGGVHPALGFALMHCRLQWGSSNCTGAINHSIWEG